MWKHVPPGHVAALSSPSPLECKLVGRQNMGNQHVNGVLHDSQPCSAKR